jgi:hypothetical protein
VLQVLLRYARSQKDRRFRRIVLAEAGTPRLVIPGDYFEIVGRDFGTQNPLYVQRTFVHHVQTLDGRSPWPEPNGELLEVLVQEANQFQEFAEFWYLHDQKAKGSLR